MVILIAEDEPSIRRALELLLKAEHDIILCEDGAQALLELAKTSVDLVITDFQMPMVSGLELIRRGKALSPSTAFILMTAFGSTNQAVEAIQLGADDYFAKPFDVSEMKHRIRKIEELRSYKIDKTLSVEEVAKRFIGESPAMIQMRKFVAAAAASTSPVLLIGGRGTGKEFTARAIHESGARAIYPFIVLDCMTSSPESLEAELFGVEKVSTKGAGVPKPGKLELARGGTLFLNGVANLPEKLQAKLVPVLRDGVLTRLAGTRPIRYNARLITASPVALKTLVDKGTFRDDLLYQLNVLTLEVPALKDRRQDLPALIEFYWEKTTREVRAASLKLAPETIDALAGYSFPGNLRELRNILERLAVVGSETGVVTPDLLPSEFRAGKGFDEQVAEFEKRLLLDALKDAERDETKAAERLRLTPEKLRAKLELYGLRKERKAA